MISPFERRPAEGRKLLKHQSTTLKLVGTYNTVACAQATGCARANEKRNEIYKEKIGAKRNTGGEHSDVNSRVWRGCADASES